MLEGHVIVGAAVSRTVTLNEQLGPASEDDRIAWVPTVKNEPDAGLFDTAPQFPVTEAAANETKAPGWPP